MGGRQKNTRNIVTPEQQSYAEFIRDFLENDRELAIQDFEKLSPAQRWQYRSALAKYAAPALASVDVNATVDNSTVLDTIKGMADI